MTDETERGKPDKGLRSIYSQIPAFHLGFLGEFLTEEEVERGLNCCTESSKERATFHNRVVRSRLGLRLSIREVIALVFPVVYSQCLTYRQSLEPEEFLNNPERVFVRDIIEQVRQGYLAVDHLSSSELDHRRSMKAFTEKYPKAVINLEKVEKVSFRLRNTISQRIIEVWRQYLDLQDAELRKSEEPSILPKPKQFKQNDINPDWQYYLLDIHRKSPQKSYHQACKELSKKLLSEGEKACSLNSVKNRTNKSW